MDFKHIIWDFDGTLFDTYPQAARAFQIVLKREYMVMEHYADIERHMRASMHHAFKHYKEKYEIDDGFIKKFKEFCAIHENQNTLPYNNVFMVCKFVYEQGGQNYLLTDRDKSVISLMQKHGFYEIFKDIITSEDKIHLSPCEDGINHLIEKYGAQKHEVLFIGDKEMDLEAAKRAGVRFCFFTEDVNKKINADFTVQNFSDLYYILNSALITKKPEPGYEIFDSRLRNE